MTKNIVLTGATGFLGNAVLQAILKNNVKTIGRRMSDLTAASSFFKSDICSNSSYESFLLGVDCIIHCAARVHVMNDSSQNPLKEFREVNTFGTLNLARQAAQAGVKRFIFISTIKVNGELTQKGHSFSEIDHPTPQDPYGISKYEAEQGLLKIAQETGLEVVIIRPPLVYGAGVKANFLNMMRWVSKGIPLPLGAVVNQRSFVALDNLVDLICVCIEHPKAKDQLFLVSDGRDVSTTELLQMMARALGVSSRLVPIPMWLLKLSAKLIGKSDMAQRLCGSLTVDISKAQELLGWAPPITVEQGLKKVANTFIQKQDK